MPNHNRLTDEQKAEIAADLGIKIGPDATARENGQITKYLVEKGLQEISD